MSATKEETKERLTWGRLCPNDGRQVVTQFDAPLDKFHKRHSASENVNSSWWHWPTKQCLVELLCIHGETAAGNDGAILARTGLHFARVVTGHVLFKDYILGRLWGALDGHFAVCLLFNCCVALNIQRQLEQLLTTRVHLLRTVKCSPKVETVQVKFLHTNMVITVK